MSELSRFLGAYFDPVHCKAVRDPVWRHIHVPNGLAALLSDRAFVKLQGIRQLGPAYLVYPGATHSRFSHSLGVLHVARRFLERLAELPEAMSLLSVEGGKAFLAAALLHDTGHFPYTHSLKELPLEEHEALTASLVLGSGLADGLRADGIDPRIVADIIDHDRPSQSSEVLFYRSVLSGVLDPDKLDYLNRDAYFCGVPYGIQDLDFILGTLRIPDGHRIGIDRSGISSIEHVLFAKYLMYRAVYWHRQVRTATAMIKQALHHALDEEAIAAAELYNLDDANFLALAASRSVRCPALGLVDAVHTRELFQTVVEIPFAGLMHAEGFSTDLSTRDRLVEAVVRSARHHFGCPLESWEAVIDIPEAISFESSMPVLTDGATVPYLESGTVFTAGVVRDFTASLRMLRVMLPARVDCTGPALSAFRATCADGFAGDWQ